MIAVAILAAIVVQAPHSDTVGGRDVPPVPPALASRAVEPPVIDGREDDAVWRTARPITDF